MDIRKKLANAIEATGHPLAPVILRGTYSNLDQLGKMMAGVKGVEKEMVTVIKLNLLSAWTDEELNELAVMPEFILALSACLSLALLNYGRKL